MTKNYSMDRLEAIAEGDTDFLKILAETFLEEIPPDLVRMVEAVENENRKLAYQFAHKMKPNLEMFGAELEKDMTAIESWSKTSKNKTNIAENVQNVSVKVKAIVSELTSDFKL